LNTPRAPQRAAIAVLALALALGAGACSRTFRGRVTQPNPLIDPTETLRDSEPVDIVTGDMDLNLPRPAEGTGSGSVANFDRYPLHNTASFTVVSRDRLRFHVQLEHKWQDWADVRGWQVALTDDRGRHWVPELCDHARTRHLVSMWDQEVRTARRNRFGDVVGLENDGWKRREFLGNLSVFQGRGDFVFYQRDIFDRNVRWLRLVVSRPGQAFEFTWSFADLPDQRIAQH
jgi:hypothetical protein